jgi:hypothetical protein
MMRSPTEIEFEVPEGNLLGVMGGKEIPPVELSAEFSYAWADPIGIDAATLRVAQQSPEKYRDLFDLEGEEVAE